MTKKEMKESIVKEFMNRCNKLVVGRSVSDEKFGKVTLIRAADHSKGWNEFLGRSGYGTRRFAVSGSKTVANGSYTLGGLRKKLTEKFTA